MTIINDFPNQDRNLGVRRFYLWLKSHPLGGPWSAEIHSWKRLHVCMCAYIVHVHSHIRLQHGAGLNIVVAMKPWHSPSDMLKSVLITESPLNLHLITSVCHIKKEGRDGVLCVLFLNTRG